MPKIARLGDPGSHGGIICSACARTKAEDIFIARIGDTYCCPEHGPNPIVSGASRTAVEGSGSIGTPLVAYDGSKTACGATIHASAERTYVE